MSLWNWKKSGWVNLSLTTLLILSVNTSICSTGIRSGFKGLTPNFSLSDLLHPEAGIFNFLLYCSAIFGFVSVSLRYSYLMDQIQVMPASINFINKIAASMGIFSFLGLIIIASFPSSEIQKDSLKTTGAYMFIGMGIMFTILQAVLTYTSSRTSSIFIIRICLAAILLSTFISSIVFVEKSEIEHSRNSNISISNDNITLSFVESTGTFTFKEENLRIACILEWTSVFVYALFYSSFFKEFQTISAYVIMRPFINYPSSDFRSSSLTVNERI